MTKTVYPPIDAEALQALRNYAKRKGRCWKDELRRAWWTASEPGPLQRIRNSHGPSWLVDFKFPPEVPEST